MRLRFSQMENIGKFVFMPMGPQHQKKTRYKEVRKMLKRMILAVIAAIALSLSALHAAAQSNWKVRNTFHIGGEGGWDYLTVDAKTHRLFVPRSTHTMVIDANSGRVLGDIPGQ